MLLDTLGPRIYLPRPHLLNMLTANGIIYFQIKLKDLQMQDSDKCKNISSPFRKDSNPSFSITRNTKNNKWYFMDYGNPDFRGDMYDFAGFLYGLSPKDNFSEIREKIYDDLEIDSLPQGTIEDFFCYTRPSIDFSHLIGKEFHSNADSFDLLPDPEMDHRIKKISLSKIAFTNLSSKEKSWMEEYGITAQAMKDSNTCFIDGYQIFYYSKQDKIFQKKSEEVWLTYDFTNYAKIYRPRPKKFWYVGKPKNYKYGSCVNPGAFGVQTEVYLVGGEKDVLTLRSRGIEAMCLNSETKIPSKRDMHGWYFDDYIKIIVLYDLDETGITQAKKLKELFGVDCAFLPKWLKDKGGKDVSDFFKLGGTVDELKSLINNDPPEVSNEASPEISIKQEGFTLDMRDTGPSTEKRLEVRTANQRLTDARNQDDILPYFGVLFQNNELTILFGDTGKGKSIAAVSIADAISKGTTFLGLENCYPPSIVLYYDFELSDKQFEKRYSDADGNIYPFSDNFYIDNIDISSFITPGKKTNFEEALISKIKSQVDQTKAKVVIIDNITYLSTSTPEDSQVALTLMKMLKELKTEKNISVLVMAHIPKKTSIGGVTLSDLAGSKHISNFADGVFTLGYSRNDKNIRYLMQVKPSRSGEFTYDSENVIICEITKEKEFLTLRYLKNGREMDLIMLQSPVSKDKQKDQMLELKKQGKTVREIGAILGMSKSTVDRKLKEN